MGQLARHCRVSVMRKRPEPAQVRQAEELRQLRQGAIQLKHCMEVALAYLRYELVSPHCVTHAPSDK